MALAPATRLGPYEIVSAIGAGGMGEVYRARDTRLGRDVAVKVLPGGVTADPERVRRFEKEARSASALNHPNIVTVYDVGSSGATSYLAMELVDGATLRDLLSGGPLPMKRLIAMRKRYKAFGRGTLEFLYPDNHRVLAFIRRYQDEVILVIANLSRFVQYAGLDLSAFKGTAPVELFGRAQFPVIRLGVIFPRSVTN